MSVSSRCRRAVAPVLCLLLFSFGSTAAQAADWSAMSSGTTKYLRGVWGSSGSDVFAVSVGTLNYGGTIQHYDGSSWSAMSSGTGQWLTGVWGSSGSNVFAVGYGGTILHYDGSSWSGMSSGTTNDLRGVWGSSGSNVFAVGRNATILHYDGSSWSAMSSGTSNEFYGVWGSSGSNVFAVGDGGTILHYDGSSWSAMSSGPSILSGIWGSSGSNVFAVGLDGTILHYDGSSWSAMSSGTGQWLNGVWGSSGSDVFAVGDYGTILHYGNGNECAADGDTLCLNNNRFRVEVSWRNYAGQTGSGHALAFRNDSGLFWFFGPSNLEMLIKVINGCGLNQRYWVYAAATTDVEYQLTVTDTTTGLSRQYFNALGNRAAAITDSSAFATCGSSFESFAPKVDLQAGPEPLSLVTASAAERTGALSRIGDVLAPADPDAILYEQMDYPSFDSIISQDFEAAYETFDAQAADDFIVPSPGWNIARVDIDGNYDNGPGPAANFNVYFYANSGNLPGALVASRLAQAYTGTAGDASITLTSPVILAAGNYWLSVQARQDYGLNGSWYWGNRTVVANRPAAWENPAGGFGLGCTTWGVKTTCAGGLSGADQLFRLIGSASSPTGCAADGDALCLNNNRFRVRITWRDYNSHTGSGWAVPYTNDSGMFWFFGADNIEFLVKVIDGCGLNSRYWVYAAATTDVEYTMTVTDTLRDVTETYTNPLGTASPAITDSSAFATCP